VFQAQFVLPATTCGTAVPATFTNTCSNNLQSFVDKIPDNGILVSKHVALETCYEVFCNIFYLVRFAGFKKYRIHGTLLKMVTEFEYPFPKPPDLL
jgi:hypothetical protein